MLKYKYIYRIVFLSTAALLFLQLPTKASAVQPEPFHYLALGDSIAKGYSCDETVIAPYPSLIQEELGQRTKDTGASVLLDNLAKNGISTGRFNKSLLEEAEVTEIISQSDLITITIGANDLIDEFKRTSQEVLGQSERFLSLGDAMDMLDSQMKEHPTFVFKAVAAIAGWDYDTFEADYCAMMDGITGQTKNGTQIIVTNVYNPTTGLGMPGTLGMVVEGIIGKMNDIIGAHADEYGYEVVDLADGDICSYVQKDGLHPTQEGQQLIADDMLSRISFGPKEEKKKVQEKVEKKTASEELPYIAAVAGMGITGVLLIFLEVSNQKKRMKRKGKR